MLVLTCMNDFLENKAEEAERSGNLPTALELWRDLATRNRDPVFFCRYGRVADELRGWDDAEAAFREALRLDTRLSLAMECMGSLWLARTDKSRDESLEIARKWFSEALKHDRNARVLTFLGSISASI